MNICRYCPVLILCSYGWVYIGDVPATANIDNKKLSNVKKGLQTHGYLDYLDQGSPESVLEGRGPAGFGCVPSSTHPDTSDCIMSRHVLTLMTR